MTDIKSAGIAICSTGGFEQSELFKPEQALEAAPATVLVLLKDASQEDYDALVWPGGKMIADILRTLKKAISFVKSFFDASKPLAATCHAPWPLIEGGIVPDLALTSCKSIKADAVNAGGRWQDNAVVVVNGVITSGNPDDLDKFPIKII